MIVYGDDVARPRVIISTILIEINCPGSLDSYFNSERALVYDYRTPNAVRTFLVNRI